MENLSNTGQKSVNIQGRLYIKIIDKFIEIRNFGSYWIHQNIDSGSIKMKRCVNKSFFDQRIMKNERKIDFLNSFIVNRYFKICFEVFWNLQVFWNQECLIKVDNKNIRTTSMTQFWGFYYEPWTYSTHLSSVSIADFDQVNVSWDVIKYH